MKLKSTYFLKLDKQLKILQLIQKPQLRGAEIFASQLSTHLLSKGHEVVLVSLFPGTAKLPFSGEHIELSRNIKHRFYDIQGWRKLAQIIAREQPDVVQANAGDTLKYAVFSKAIFKWKVPLVFRNANKMGDFIDTKVKYRVNNFFLKKVDYVISVSKNCEADLIDTFNFPKNRIITVPIGVEVNHSESSSSLDRGPDLSRSSPLFINVASLVPEKNHQGLLRIFKNVLLTLPNAKLFIVGEGRLKEDLQKLIIENQLENSVSLLGSRNDAKDLIASADVFLLPSLIEGLPGVILEAMVSKTPVVAYNVGGIGEVIKKDSTGWVLEPGDETGFINAIEDIVSNPGRTNSIVDNAFNHVITQYSNSEISAKFLLAYKSLF